MKVIVAGSRGINDQELIIKIVAASGMKITELICGMARGVDLNAREVLERQATQSGNWLSVQEHWPDWENEGKAAGYKRNLRMAKEADGLIAIWNGESKGTKHMIDIMRGMNKPCFIWNTKEQKQYRYDFEIGTGHRDDGSLRGQDEPLTIRSTE